ncbi:peptide ABC transporter ATP-binding protein [Leifsonia xyli subsp. xyli]|uniref:Oligopeptide porter n=2 Tax=Leifsonia xyli subsp. xyli TaxID=59736 RepID=Q6ADA0_LEIXX|nr:ATP-binding cassette domain-containing protein [Leifsonia xyli]AAT89644.1 oligopeptide porter [Leifsonia xyli subsp. xyli str. CTCB07]ODA91247.1 peptide ABC transporter ATP-binding protein [Leifsonia xyli subsp. xyli]
MTVILKLREAGFRYRRAPVWALDGVSFAVEPGRSVGLVGESGAGKTTMLSLLLGLAAPTSGSVEFDGVPLDRRDRARMREFRRSVQAVFQDPYSSLNPRQSVGRIVGEPLASLKLASGAEARDRVAEALRAVALPAEAAQRYRHEFSGGQRQRIAIARAIVPRPRVLLADEPVSELDVTTRIQIIELLGELTERNEMTIVMVSHDLSVVAALCRQAVVLRGGRVVEQGPTQDVLGAPADPYTQRLIASVPRLPAV